MKIDVVVGNPPYNNDLYLDFVTKAYEQSSNLVCMITPAKWQAKGGEKNEQFRKNIVPHMNKIVYYPDTDDVFNVRMSGGISYYEIDKDTHDIKNTKVISSRCKSFRSDWEEQEIISIHKKSINNIIKSCIGNRIKLESIKGQKYVGDRDSKIPYKKDGSISVMQGEEECGRVNKEDIRNTGIRDIDKYKCVMHSMLISPVTNSDGTHLGIKKPLLLKPNQVPKGIYFEIYCDKSENTIKSVQSYFNCKLIRFLFYISAMSTYMEESNFDKIPDPGAFDRIFVDRPDPITQPNAQPDKNGNYEYNGQKYCSLYTKYGLKPEEINIIESVIKERK